MNTPEFTPEQRLEIYKRALALQFNDRPPYSICVCIKDACLELHPAFAGNYIKYLPELLAQEPPPHKKNGMFWWNSRKLQPRLDALQACIDEVKLLCNQQPQL